MLSPPLVYSWMIMFVASRSTLFCLTIPPPAAMSYCMDLAVICEGSKGQWTRTILLARCQILGESYFVHVLKQFVFLDELVLQDKQLGWNLTIFYFQSIDLHLGLHVLLVEILTWLQSHLVNDRFILVLSFASRLALCLWWGGKAERFRHFYCLICQARWV